MTKGKFSAVALVFGLLVQAEARAAHANKMKIGFVLATVQEERYQKDIKFFKEEAEKLGFEPVVASAENSEQTQRAKVENLLSQGVKALVIQPVNSQAAAALVKVSHEDKVPVIAYDRLIADAPVDAYVTMDSFKVGALQAEEAVKFTKGAGNYVILMGEAGHSVANEITRGALSVIEKHPKIKVVVKKSHEAWSSSLAMATVENALTQNGNRIDAVLANNSGMAQGASQALAEQGLSGKVFLAGADADLASIKNIVAGKQHFEVLKDISPLARAAAQAAFQLGQGQKVAAAKATVESGKHKVPTVLTPVYPVHKGNLEERIFATGFHPRSAFPDLRK